jgi:ubiquinone/menaquinone biosynthesis C-methylase UbiE
MVRRVSVQSDRVAVIGAGTSALALNLARTGDRSVVAVDIAGAALDQLRHQLGEATAAGVTFVESNVCDVELPTPVAVWHDRATLHFLTDAAEQRRYACRAAATVRPGGHLVLAQFAPAGPEQCSGLPVARHDVADLVELFTAFALVESEEHEHRTPWGSPQLFLHTVFRRT